MWPTTLTIPDLSAMNKGHCELFAMKAGSQFRFKSEVVEIDRGLATLN
jgi:hypothetical protein